MTAGVVGLIGYAINSAQCDSVVKAANALNNRLFGTESNKNDTTVNSDDYQIVQEPNFHCHSTGADKTSNDQSGKEIKYTEATIAQDYRSIKVKESIALWNTWRTSAFLSLGGIQFLIRFCIRGIKELIHKKEVAKRIEDVRSFIKNGFDSYDENATPQQ